VASIFDQAFRITDLTAQFVKDTYLTGLTLLGSNGQELPDSWFEHHLRAAFRELCDTTHIDILKVDYVAERHDYHLTDYVSFAFLKLFHLPVLEVKEVRAMYPTGNSVQVYPSEWVKLEAAAGQINLVPTSGSSIVLLQNGSWLPLAYGGVSHLPHLWEVDYTAGMDQDNIPLLIVDTICKWAVVNMLTIISNTVRPLGVTSQSTSVDGLSQSRSFTQPAFKAMLDQYRAELGLPLPPGGRDLAAGLIRQVRDTYYGINLTVAG